MGIHQSENDPSRLRSLPIRISIRIESKSHKLKDLLTWTSGTILKFDHPVSSPLNLYVANQKMGEGMAVKVDSSIGLKLSQIIQH